jgi:hypothetical protein
VAMSISSLALVGVLRPSLLTRSRQVVPGALLRKSPDVVPQGFSRLLAAASEIPGVPRAHVCALKLPAKALTRSS